MKSLRESLFDSEKNITKDITIGDLFEYDEEFSNGYRLLNLDKEFSYIRVRRLTKVSADDHNEIIYKGMAKIVQELKIDVPLEEADKQWLHDKLEKIIWDLFQYSTPKKDISISLHRNRALVLIRDESIFNVDTVQIMIGRDLRLVFHRK